jgi:hypothetical protein
MLRTLTDPAALETTMDFKLDTRVETTFPDGTVVVDSIATEPRFGIAAPVPAGTRIRLPSGISRKFEVTRTYDTTTFNPPDIATSHWVEQARLNGNRRSDQ